MGALAGGGAEGEGEEESGVEDECRKGEEDCGSILVARRSVKKSSRGGRQGSALPMGQRVVG